jgi:hypothetical protein
MNEHLRRDASAKHHFAKLVQSHEDTLLSEHHFTIPPPYPCIYLAVHLSAQSV